MNQLLNKNTLLTTLIILILCCFSLFAIAGEMPSNSDKENSTGEEIKKTLQANITKTHVMIEFELKETSLIAIRLNDAIGQEIAPIYDGELSADTIHTFPINISTLNTGVYLVEIRNLTNNTKEYRKIRLTK